MKRTESEGKKITPVMKRRLDAAVNIQMDPRATEMVFMARPLVQATLPHSDPGDVPLWCRTNGNLTLSIKPDWERDPKTNKSRCVGVPYGTIPRLLLFWLTTEAVKAKSRKIELGDSLSAFMREIGLEPTGGVNGTIGRLREQMKRLFRSKISFEMNLDSDGQKGNAWMDMQIASKGEFWWNEYQPDQQALWKSWVELSESFFESICAAPVPVDMRALSALKNSPMALDLYAWMNYRTFALQMNGGDQFVSWNLLAQQLGADYSNIYNFITKFKESLKKVESVSPGIDFEYIDGGLLLKPGKTAIMSKARKSNSSTKSGG